MKANKKFKQNTEAVSAVIGVILMVAITVAIAATAYLYFNGMIGKTQQIAPVFQLRTDEILDELIVSSADTDTDWSRISISADKAGTLFHLNGAVVAGDTAVTTTLTQVTTTSAQMIATQYIALRGNPDAVSQISYTIVDNVANEEIGTYTFESIAQI